MFIFLIKLSSLARKDIILTNKHTDIYFCHPEVSELLMRLLRCKLYGYCALDVEKTDTYIVIKSHEHICIFIFSSNK